MDTQPHTAAVVVGVDGSRSAFTAVRWAVTEARQRGLALRILHAAPCATGPEGPGSLHVRGILGAAFTIARRTAPEVIVSTGSSVAPPVDALIGAARTAQLVVVGTPTERADDFRSTSVALELPSRAPCPVAVVRGRIDQNEPVLVGVRDPEADRAVVAVAFAEARLHRCGLVALQAHGSLATPMPGPTRRDLAREARLTEVLRAWSDRYPEVEVRVRTPREDPTTALLATARHTRLLVVGTHRRGRHAGAALGSHARAMLRHSPVPVLVVDPAGWPGARPPGPSAVVGAEQT